MSDRDHRLEKPYARVLCPEHGYVLLEFKEYLRQMDAPWDKWHCPICNSVSEFDDDWFEMTHFPSGDSGADDL